MKYELKKTISGITINSEDGINYKAHIDYTVYGEAIHKGVSIPISSGITVSIDIPSSLVDQADRIAQQAIAEKYIDDEIQ